MTIEQQQRPRRRGTLIVAAVFVVVIVIAGVVVGILLGLRGNHATADPSNSASARPSTSTPAARTTEGACGLVPYETTNNLSAAPETKWVAWSATTLATSSSAGPEKNTDGVRTCYSRTAAGALFAAYNAAQYCADSSTYAAAMSAVVAPGPGRNTAVSNAKSAAACEPSGPYVEGYKVASYDGESATLYLEVNAPSGLFEFGAALVWKSGDWKLLLDADGNPTVASSQLASSAGFTPWGPTNG
ncbi:hypothetical protein [Leifsonia shinshuensis]